MNEQYNSLFEKTIADYCKIVKPLDNKKDVKYVLSYPHVGKNYDTDKIMIVGRALDGWRFPFTPAEGGKKVFKDLKEHVETIDKDLNLENAFIEFNKTGLVGRFGNNYRNIKRLRFWQVTGSVIPKLYKTTHEDWTNSVAWTNICKINPKFKNISLGLPDKAETDAQLVDNNILELFKLELETLKPKLVIMFTDDKWSTLALKYLGIKTQFNEDIVKQAVNYNDSLILVCQRPDIEGMVYTNQNLIHVIVNAAQKK